MQIYFTSEGKLTDSGDSIEIKCFKFEILVI